MKVKIAERRKELGLTQTELARMAKVGQRTISDIETGRHVPRVDVAIQVSRALNRMVEELFLVDDQGNATPL